MSSWAGVSLTAGADEFTPTISLDFARKARQRRPVNTRTLSSPSILTWPRGAALVLAATIVLAASAWVQIPLWPVPVTLQSLAVCAIGLTLGRRLATLAVVAYLVEGIGLPVFAGGAAGLHVLVGPTGGYLAGFVAAAALTGEAADRGFARSVASRAATMLAAHATMLAVGAAWLALFVGVRAVWALGVAPFLVGTAVKVAFGASAPAVVRAFARRAD